jgi:hypothetical protein
LHRFQHTIFVQGRFQYVISSAADYLIPKRIMVRRREQNYARSSVGENQDAKRISPVRLDKSAIK